MLRRMLRSPPSERARVPKAGVSGLWVRAKSFSMVRFSAVKLSPRTRTVALPGGPVRVARLRSKTMTVRRGIWVGGFQRDVGLGDDDALAVGAGGDEDEAAGGRARG